ncbi:hypothetical protein I3843_01G260300 [Carya illinoinensis]|nr:hypothetical protein I3843_01G260300 [Carya illinoinensis]
MEWSFNSETMELNTGGFCCNGKQPSGHSTSTDKEKQPLEKDLSTSIFVNHAAIAWHESRKRWVGDQSRRSKRKAKEPIIRYLLLPKILRSKGVSCSCQCQRFYAIYMLGNSLLLKVVVIETIMGDPTWI